MLSVESRVSLSFPRNARLNLPIRTIQMHGYRPSLRFLKYRGRGGIIEARDPRFDLPDIPIFFILIMAYLLFIPSSNFNPTRECRAIVTINMFF